MKNIISVLVFACISAISLSAQNPVDSREIEVTVLLDSTDYILEFDPETNLCCISNTPQSKYAFLDDCQEIGSPWIPWCSVMIPINQEEEFVSFTSSFVEASVVDTVSIAPYSALMPTSDSKSPNEFGTGGDDDWDGTYPKEIYPDHLADYVSTIRVPDWAKDKYKADKVIFIQVCPFRYYAHEQVLKLLKVQLQITVRGVVDAIALPSPELSYSNFLDLSGRRLPSLPTQKGIYIKDGRKVMIK